MTIQLSVTIWTVICFILLMLILHHLLFKPVLGVMDARRERIENAARKKAEQERLAREGEAMRLEREAAARAARQKQVKEAVEAIQLESRDAIEAAKKEQIRHVDEYRERARAEQAENLNALSAHAAGLAAAFADRLTKE